MLCRLKHARYFQQCIAILAATALHGTSLAQESQEAAQDSWQPWAPQVEAAQARYDEANAGLNFREENVPAYELPDPLVFEDGTPVKTIEDWNDRRRPEILNLFREYVYGIRPTTPHEVDFEEVARLDNVYDIGALALHVRATVTADNGSLSFDFVLVLPKSDGPVPLIMLINHRWTISSLDQVVGETRSNWPAEKLVRRGYATVSMGMSKVDPDNRNGYQEGIRALLDAPDSDPMTRWHTLSAWGWSASRALDYCLEQHPIDPERTAVVGHSRGGKTALWAGAEDTRFKLVYSNNSGCGGAALSRRSYGESVARINQSFPHWFCGNFDRFSNNESELPVDQHQLIALIAPRAVYVASADRDLWADPRGEYLSFVHAGPVYELFGLEHITNPTMPSLDTPRHVGQTGYHILSGRHSLAAGDWDLFLQFADQVFEK